MNSKILRTVLALTLVSLLSGCGGYWQMQRDLKAYNIQEAQRARVKRAAWWASLTCAQQCRENFRACREMVAGDLRQDVARLDFARSMNDMGAALSHRVADQSRVERAEVRVERSAVTERQECEYLHGDCQVDCDSHSVTTWTAPN